MKPKLLVLDDDAAVLELFTDAFSDEFEVLLEKEGTAALDRIRGEHPSIAVIDIRLPGGKSGIEVLREAKQIDPGMMVVMTTGYGTTRSAIEAMKYGAYDYVTKPFRVAALKSIVKNALECSQLNRKVRYTKDRERDSGNDEDVMIGSSPEMIEIWKMVGKAAPSDATVLIQGESGTGKELLARAIYNNSRRKNRAFLAVNCAAIPENLLESELFGHEKGAFTDAHSRRIGKFEQCNGGTIFLDEIGEMSPASQGKLLRVLENQEFQRVGGNETINVDVRIIAATNRSLVTAVKDKTFRIDLFYRLRVVSFFIPPLRERIEDIPLLVDLFIRKFSDKHGKEIKGITPPALDLLTRNQWDGNIRELQNVINSAVVFSKSDYLVAEDFRSLLTSVTAGRRDRDNFGADHLASFKSMLEPEFDDMCRKESGFIYENLLVGMEKALILLALEKTGNNQVMTAKLLGMSRNTLRDRIERYRLG